MLTEILNSSSVQRLKGILRNRYGTGLKVSFMMDVSSIDTTAQSPSVIEGDLRIPILADGNLLATAFVEKASCLSSSDQKDISELVEMILQPAIQNWCLKTLEAQMPGTSDQFESNVLPFHRSMPTPFERAPEIQSLSTSVMYLQGKKPQRTVKIAYDLHELTGRWACLRYSDIKAQIRSAQDLAALGAATIIIEDVLMLSPQELEIFTNLLENQSENRSADSPLLLFAGTLAHQELKAQQLLEAKFLALISTCIIEVDRLPLDPTLLNETLELFLEPGRII